jgi:hypothetical protein
MSGSAGIFAEDSSFDATFPRYVRERSARYWTPVAVAARAAAIFREQGATRILDVGCDPLAWIESMGSVLSVSRSDIAEGSLSDRR